MHERTAPLREGRATTTGASWMAGLTGALPRQLGVGAAAGLFLAVLSPLGTGDTSLLIRLAYWVGLAAGGTLIGATIRFLWARVADPGDQRPFTMAVLTAAVMTPPTCGLVWLATRLAFGPHVAPLFELAFEVFVICLALSLVQTLAAQRDAPQSAAPALAPGGAPRTPKFLERFPPRLRGAELHAVEAEDHYLRLHTSRGQDLILMRLGDAVAELDGLPGARTHRSWWVARAAVTEVRRGDGRATLVLSSGVEAPVSRKFFRVLRDAAWF